MVPDGDAQHVDAALGLVSWNRHGENVADEEKTLEVTSDELTRTWYDMCQGRSRCSMNRLPDVARIKFYRAECLSHLLMS